MKAIQIKNYSKEINTALSDIPKPQISDSEVLIQVKAAAVNLICSGPSKGRYQRCFFVPAIVGTTLISAFYAMIMCLTTIVLLPANWQEWQPASW